MNSRTAAVQEWIDTLSRKHDLAVQRGDYPLSLLLLKEIKTVVTSYHRLSQSTPIEMLLAESARRIERHTPRVTPPSVPYARAIHTGTQNRVDIHSFSRAKPVRRIKTTSLDDFERAINEYVDVASRRWSDDRLVDARLASDAHRDADELARKKEERERRLRIEREERESREREQRSRVKVRRQMLDAVEAALLAQADRHLGASCARTRCQQRASLLVLADQPMCVRHAATAVHSIAASMRSDAQWPGDPVVVVVAFAATRAAERSGAEQDDTISVTTAERIKDPTRASLPDVLARTVESVETQLAQVVRDRAEATARNQRRELELARGHEQGLRRELIECTERMSAYPAQRRNMAIRRTCGGVIAATGVPVVLASGMLPLLPVVLLVVYFSLTVGGRAYGAQEGTAAHWRRMTEHREELDSDYDDAVRKLIITEAETPPHIAWPELVGPDPLPELPAPTKET